MFYNINRARQLISFDGMDWDGASLTDIDFCLEFRDNIWVLGEVKGKDVNVPKGQKLLLNRFVNMARKSGKHAIAMVVEHHVWDYKEIVQLRDCQVREYLTTETGRWAMPRRPFYVEEMITQYISLCEGGRYCNGQVASGLQKTG